MDIDGDQNSASNTQRASSPFTAAPPGNPRAGSQPTLATSAAIIAAVAENRKDNLDTLLAASVERMKQLEDELRAATVSH